MTVDVNDVRMATVFLLESKLNESGINTRGLYDFDIDTNYTKMRELTEIYKNPPKSKLGQFALMLGEFDDEFIIRKEDLKNFNSALKSTKPIIRKVWIRLQKPYDSVVVDFTEDPTSVYTQDPEGEMPVKLSLKIGEVTRSIGLRYKGRNCTDLVEEQEWQT